MKLKLKRIMTVLTIFSIIMATISLEGISFATEKTYKVGDKFTEKGIGAGDNAYVLQILNADLNKDKQNERIYLVGNKMKEFDKTAYDKLSYVIRDGKTKKNIVHTMKIENGVYDDGFTPFISPKIQISDLDRDGQNEILLISKAQSIEGGVFMYSNIATLKSGKVVMFKDIPYWISGEYLKNYKMNIMAKNMEGITKVSWVTDISNRKSIYQEEQIYDSQGNVSEEAGGPSNATIDTIELDSSKRTLKVSYDVCAARYDNKIATAYLSLKYENGNWQIESSSIKKY